MLRILVALALVPWFVQGDDSSPAEPRMVDLNVVAVDSHGQPVTDLTRDEFRVTDSGRPQTIAFFRLRNSSRAVPRLAPHEFSNRTAANIPRATLILFDLLNEDFSTRGTAAYQLTHDLASLETSDYVYLYLLTVDGRLYAVHGLPGPESEPDPPGGAPWTARIKPLLDQALRVVTRTRPVDIDVAVRVPLTYNALAAVAAELSRVPGHKNIVWITDGVPIELGPRRSDTGDFVDFTPLLRQLSEALDRDGVAIYPVRQIMLGSPDSVGHAATSGLGSVDTLAQFAEMTGGRPDAGKDIGAALRQAITDARTSYQIGYYPPEKNWDDKYHKLRVTCTRKGVCIQAKTAYYAWRDAPGSESEQAIDSAAATTFDAAEIGLRATLTPDPPGGRAMRLEARIDARDLVMVHDGDRYKGELRLDLVGYAPGEPARREPVMPFDVHLSAQERDTALQQGIAFAQNINVPDSIRSVRLIVFDRGSKSIGSVTVPVSAAHAAPK